MSRGDMGNRLLIACGLYGWHYNVSIPIPGAFRIVRKEFA